MRLVIPRWGRSKDDDVTQRPWCPRCGDAQMLGGDAPGATYWVCPNCRRDLLVGHEAKYLEEPLPHRAWRPGDQSDWRERLAP